MANPHSAKRQVEQVLPTPLGQYLKAHTAKGTSLAAIAADVYRRTGVPVSRWTIRRWIIAEGAEHVGS